MSAEDEHGAASSLPVQVPQTHHTNLVHLTEEQLRTLAAAGEPMALKALLAPVGIFGVIAGAVAAGTTALYGAWRAGVGGVPAMALMVGAAAVGAAMSAGAVGAASSAFDRIWLYRRRQALRAKARRWHLAPDEVEQVVARLCQWGQPTSYVQALIELEHLTGRELRKEGETLGAALDEAAPEWGPPAPLVADDDEDD